jgi:hypothetical protein
MISFCNIISILFALIELFYNSLLVGGAIHYSNFQPTVYFRLQVKSNFKSKFLTVHHISCDPILS